MNKKSLNIIKWTARIISLFTIAIGLLMYFGYGDLYPFANPDYGLLDNLWRLLFPLMFLGFAIAWKYEKIGGYMIVFSILTRFFSCLITQDGISVHMAIPLFAGFMFIIVGYSIK